MNTTLLVGHIESDPNGDTVLSCFFFLIKNTKSATQIQKWGRKEARVRTYNLPSGHKGSGSSSLWLD